jgi:hypothetical protein
MIPLEGNGPKMEDEYLVELSEATTYYSKEEKRIHHPLDSYYTNWNGKGLLSFMGANLSQYPIFDDVKVFSLRFYGGKDKEEREAWADPIRSLVLKRLNHLDWHWYLSFTGWIYDPTRPSKQYPLEEEIIDNFIQKENIDYTFVESADFIGPGHSKRLFFEVPDSKMDHVISKFWPLAIPTEAIQGYQLPAGQIDLLEDWDQRPRDEKLFREVIDQVFAAFYTFPAENRHFAFVTNKLNLENISNLINLPDLQEEARRIQNTRQV